VLTGSLLRVPLGVLGDRIGGRRIGLALLLFLFAPLSLAWRGEGSLTTLLGVGLMLGTAGASFAVVLPLASRWYSAERQGLVMGIAAAGNSGTVLANIFAPRLANVFGWHTVFGLAMIPLAAALLVFFVLAKDAPGKTTTRSMNEYLATIGHTDARWFCFFYAITFGGYVGMSSFLPVFLRDQFGLTPVNAGSLTALAAFAGSLSRPIGGYLADRLGGARVLQGVLIVIALAYVTMATLPALGVMGPLIVSTMIALGLGNGVVFQLVPQRFARDIGSVTGLIGAVGGIGGFVLPMLLGSMKQGFGSYGGAFAVLAIVATTGALSIWALQRPEREGSWTRSLVAEN
jgi:NNP family nitrate/nitrite transporter-like MFS transporter